MPKPSRATLPAVLALALAACSSSPRIEAARGGTVRGDAITVVVPPGALSADADVDITRVASPPAAGPDQTAASGAYRVVFKRHEGSGSLTLGQPIQVEMAANPAPVHPQLGEIATLSGAAWQRLPASFTRPSGTVVALSREADATYQVTLRALRRADPASAAAQNGFQVFMYDTFGNEDFFTAVGLASLLNGVKPADAVALGVQVDLARVPAGVAAVMTGSDLAAKDAALQNPAVTVALVKAGAVVGVVDRSAPGDAAITRVGITCALCHQLVTPTTFQLSSGPAALPIGSLAVDGRPNLKMDAGKILSLTSGVIGLGLAPTLGAWGANLFDIRSPATANAALDDGVNDPTTTPPIWNFVDLEAEGYPFGYDGLFAGENALASQAEVVYHLVMNGKGAFGTPNGALPPALRVSPPQRILDRLPGAAVPAGQVLITAAKLLDLQTWMRSVTSPAPGAFDAAKAEAGWKTFATAGCTTCHKTAELSGDASGPFVTTVPGAAPKGDLAGGIRPPGLRGVTSKGPPYLHDGSGSSLADVVAKMGQLVGGLPAADQANVVEYLKSL